MMQETFSIEDALSQPEHWQRAETLIADIGNLSEKYEDCNVRAQNATQNTLEHYPKLIQYARSRGDEAEAQRSTQHMDELDRQSVSQTEVRIVFKANSKNSYNALRRELNALMIKHRAQETQIIAEYIPESVPETFDYPFDLDSDYIYFEMHCVCDENLVEEK